LERRHDPGPHQKQDERPGGWFGKRRGLPIRVSFLRLLAFIYHRSIHPVWVQEPWPLSLFADEGEHEFNIPASVVWLNPKKIRIPP
jgi:hypothetical protein